MAELFDDESCVRWWLPNDEGFSPLLQGIRAIADERNAMAVATQRESLQQIRHVFSRMQIGDDADSASRSPWISRWAFGEGAARLGAQQDSRQAMVRRRSGMSLP